MMGLTAEDNLANTAENNFEIKYCKSKVNFEGTWNLLDYKKQDEALTW